MSDASLRAIIGLLLRRRKDGYVSGLDTDGEHVALVVVAGIRLHNAINYVHRLTQDPAVLRLAAEVSRNHVLEVFEKA